MRAYGNNTEILIDREREIRSFALLAERQLAPALLARFENGLLYRYVPGRVCSPKDLISEPIWRGVAKRLGEWHGRVPITSQVESTPWTNGATGQVANGIESSPKIAARAPRPNIWAVMQKWLLIVPAETEAEKARKALLQAELERCFEELDKADGLGHKGLIFGHCDLLSANVIVMSKGKGINPTDTDRSENVTFIDYEYSTPCPAAFDIANHFAEWGGYDCDYSMLPTKSIRRAFLEDYLDSYQKHSGATFAREEALEALIGDVDKYRGMPGFYWGIWALIQATISQIDFDYADYAEVRLSEYWAFRDNSTRTREKERKGMHIRESRWVEE